MAARPSVTPRSRAPSGRESSQLAFDDGSVIGFKDGESGIEQAALRNYDDVEPRRDLVATKELSNQPFGAISHDGAAQLLRGGNAETTRATPRRWVWQDENRAVPTADFRAAVVNLLKIRPPTYSLSREETFRWRWRQPLTASQDSELTVRRFRPLARRRFRTSRPFLVLMRTRKPCRRLRRRRLG